MRKNLGCSFAVALIALGLLGSGHVSARLIPVTHCLRGIVNKDFANSTWECWTVYEDDGSGSGGFPFGGEHGDGDHGGGVNHDNRGDRDDVTDASTGDGRCDDGSNPISGNPIVLATGDKIEPELDFASTGELPLTLARTYNHFWKYVGLFGKHWVSSFDYSLVWQSNDTLIFAQRPDGRRIKFVRIGATNRWNEDKPTPIAYILKNADGTYAHYTEGNGVETYDGGGKPLKIANAHGIGWTYIYTNNYPTRITHTSGRYVQLGWTTGQLTTVTDPSGGVFTFVYTANAFGSGVHRLASATHPGSAGDPATTIAYFYEDARYLGGLTGKAYNGVRYSTFAYDDQARAIKSEHATGGIDRFTYAYAGTPIVPPAPPPDPPPPGSVCNPTTHQCPAPPVIDGSDPNDPALVERAARAAAEDDVIAHVDATTSVLETNPLGLKTTYTFADGRLTSTSGQATAYCAARSKSRAYDANGNESTIADFNGNSTHLTYNAKGQLTQRVEAYGTAVARTTTYGWDPTYNLPSSETVAGDHATTYTYTADHRLASVTVKNLAANGVANQTHTWTFAYTKYASGLLQTMVVDGPQNASDQITYSYSTAGDLISVSNTHGDTTSYGLYDGNGRAGRVIGPNGDETDLTYYPDGHVKQVTTHPNGVAATTSFTYLSGLLATSKTPDNVTTGYTYDAARRLSDASRPELNGTGDRKTFYDLGSHPTRIEIYRGATLRYRAYVDYDEAGRVRARRGNNGQNVRYAYDNGDNVLTLTDSLGRITHFAYDALDRLTQTTDAKNGITKYEYDKGDRVSKITDPKGVATSYTYDGFGQVWKEASPDRGTTTYGYTASGFRNAMTRANGLSEAYAYDDIGRLTSISAGALTQTFGYDTCTYGKGRVCTIADPSGTQSYTYTKEGLVASQQAVYAPPHGGASSVGYTYDTMGRPLTITNTSSTAQQQQFTYGSGQLSAVKLKIGAAAAVNVATAFSYEPMGPLTGFTYGNGLARTKTYDLDRRLTAITETGASGIQSLGFAYNANDAITTLTNSVNAALSQAFGYDELSRLMTVTSTSGNEGFTYDANGNRLTDTTGAGLATLSYLPGTNRLGSWLRAGSATRSYGYDAAGNTIALLGKTYTYSPFNRLMKVSGGGSTATYDVNALGERVYKNRDGVETFFVYTPDHALLSEYTHGGTGWNDYIRVGGEPIATVRNGALYYVHGDQLGRPEVVTNGAKAVVWRAWNFAFGRAVPIDAFGGLNLGFPGQYYDQEVGSWYNVNRDYDSVTGRYLQSDPIGLRLSTNPYVYASSAPTTRLDALGLVDLNLFNPEDPLHENANAVHSPDGVFTVGAHGTPTDVRNAFNQPMTADQLAEQIKNDPHWKDGMRVELDACNTASDPGNGGEPFAAKLAEAMETPVSGANNFVWIYPNGNVYVAPIAPSGGPNLGNPGGFTTYVPIGP